MSALTRWVLAHRRLVAVFWLLILLAGGATAGTTTKRLTQKFSVPGREGWVTNEQIAHLYRFTGGNGAPLIPVVTLPQGTRITAPSVRMDLLAVERRAKSALPGSRIASYASTGSRAFLSPDGHVTFVIVQPPADRSQAFADNPRAVERLDAALAHTTVAGAPVRVTGIDALSKQSGGGGGGPGVLLETLVGGLGALAVLAFVFASLLAFVPLLVATVSIMGSFLVILGLTLVTDVSPIVQFLVALIGLGVAIDYSLLVVVRWREERAHGKEGDEAILSAMETAGRAVVFSGTTVAIGLLALIALPLPFLRSVGFGGLVIPLVSVLVSVTLVPVILARFGERLDWPHVRTDDRASAAWTRWAEGVIRRRVPAAALALAVIVGLVVAGTALNPGTPNPDTLAKQGQARAALVALERSGAGSGVLLPDEILVHGSGSAVAARVGALNGMNGAVAPSSPAWHSAGTSLVEALPRPEVSSDAGQVLLTQTRDAVHAMPGASLGGVPQQNSDFIDAVYGNFPLMIVLIAVITFILLARAFRSLLLPLKAILLNVMSVGAAWGVITLVWQQGHGSGVWGIGATHSITAWIPLMIFAFLFGLSMDYEVFILARIREEYDAGGRTDAAVVSGVGRTGRLVTSAALILFLAFASLSSGPETDIKVMATGLAAGILLDATVIRSLLVPALVSLFGRWNWWLPSLPARLLRVEPSLIQPEEA